LHRDTILRLLVLAGERCIAVMDGRMRGETYSDIRILFLQHLQESLFVLFSETNVNVQTVAILAGIDTDSPIPDNRFSRSAFRVCHSA
jgi:hypothetical protein